MVVGHHALVQAIALLTLAVHTHQIVRGRLARKCQFPYIAYVHGYSIHQRTTCGGTLIDDSHVVTAAHCVNDDHRKYFLLFGSINAGKMPIRIPVREIIKHRNFTRFPRPEKSPISRFLFHAKVPLLTYNHCHHLSPKVTDHNVCAGQFVIGAPTTCEGDSGGPLVCTRKRDRRNVLVGIVSYGWKCQEGLSVFSKVSFYKEWILRNSKPHHVQQEWGSWKKE